VLLLLLLCQRRGQVMPRSPPKLFEKSGSPICGLLHPKHLEEHSLVKKEKTIQRLGRQTKDVLRANPKLLKHASKTRPD
jgi:hypothetical protein